MLFKEFARKTLQKWLCIFTVIFAKMTRYKNILCKDDSVQRWPCAKMILCKHNCAKSPLCKDNYLQKWLCICSHLPHRPLHNGTFVSQYQETLWTALFMQRNHFAQEPLCTGITLQRNSFALELLCKETILHRNFSLQEPLCTWTTLHRNWFVEEPLCLGTTLLRSQLAGTAWHRPIGSS